MVNTSAVVSYKGEVRLTRWEGQHYVSDQESPDDLIIRTRYQCNTDDIEIFPTLRAAQDKVNADWGNVFDDFWMTTYDGTSKAFMYADLYLGNILWRATPA